MTSCGCSACCDRIVSPLSADWLCPDWPAPARVRSCVTTRQPGVSLPPYDAFNLALHVGDDPRRVAHNRALLCQRLGCQPGWLEQVHGTQVVAVDPQLVRVADANWTDQPGLAACVMTADCLPALFCDRTGRCVAAAHAGWRGLLDGVLEATLQALPAAPEDVLVWLGPAIGPASFEVGDEVREAFVARQAQAAQAFQRAAQPGKWLADLYLLARQRLAGYGVTAIYGGGFDTFRDPRFYSYRRGTPTGRFASLVWLQD